MNTPPQEPMPNHAVQRYWQFIANHWKWLLICSIVLGVILGVALSIIKAITGHDYTNALFEPVFRVVKVMVVVADVGVFYVAATVAWASYKHPESPTLPEAAQRVRSLAVMIGALLLMFITQLFLFSRI